MHWARTFLGLKPIASSAEELEPNLFVPVTGSIILIGKDHAGVVLGLIGTAVVYADSNYHLDGRIEVGKTILASDNKIRGYWIPTTLAFGE